MSDLKEKLRSQMREKLGQTAPVEKFEASLAAANILKSSDLWQRSKIIMLFASMKDEPDTSPLIQAAWDEGKAVCLPVIVDEKARQMEARFLTTLNHLTPGPLGFRQPDSAHCPVMEREQIDLILVPGLAFDRSSNRLGRGAGYYDRFLSSSSKKNTIAGYFFSFQETKDIPNTTHDVQLDWIVTEKEMFSTKNRAPSSA